jgi:hypothetical protein
MTGKTCEEQEDAALQGFKAARMEKYGLFMPCAT